MSGEQEMETPEIEQIDTALEPEAEPRRKPLFDGLEAEDGQFGRKVQQRISSVVKQRKIVEAEAAELRARLTAAETARIAAETRAAEYDYQISRAAAQQAHGAGDPAAFIDSTAKVSEAAARVDRLKREASQVAQVPQAPAYSPAAQAWIAQNEWFNTDARAKGAAIEADAAARSAGLVADSPEYFGFIESAVSRRFPRYFETQAEQEEAPPPQQRQAVTMAAAARRTAAPVAPRTPPLPQLSAEEVDLARTMGIKPELWAANKLKMQQRKP